MTRRFRIPWLAPVLAAVLLALPGLSAASPSAQVDALIARETPPPGVLFESKKDFPDYVEVASSANARITRYREAGFVVVAF